MRRRLCPLVFEGPEANRLPICVTSTLDICSDCMTSLLVFMKDVIDRSILKELKWLGPTILFCAGLLLFRGSSGGGATVVVIGNTLLVVVVVWMFLRCRNSHDEVVRAANFAALAVGAPIGLGLALGSIFVVRLVPQVSAFVGGLVPDLGGNSSVTAGFGIGVLFTIGLVALSSILAWGIWWISKR